jgi:hypothetical protein
MALRAGKAVGRLALGAGLLAGGAVAGRHVLARGLWHITFAAGNLTGLVGLRFAEYADDAAE